MNDNTEHTPPSRRTPAPAARSESTELALTLSPEDLHTLTTARRQLEHPSLAARLSSVLGTPVEVGFKLLPKDLYGEIQWFAEKAIAKSLDAAISSLRPEPETIMPRPRFHRLLGITSGAVGGFFGPTGLLVELPISTTLMLRSIADIARSEGEDLGTVDTRLACIKVFALGGRTEEDDAADTGYYGVRLALALPIADAAAHIAEKGLAREGGPALANLVAKIAARFSVVVSQKTALQLVPLIGAASGAMVNGVFMQHFQTMAWGHFTVRRLERKYGPGTIMTAYQRLST